MSAPEHLASGPLKEAQRIHCCCPTATELAAIQASEEFELPNRGYTSSWTRMLAASRFGLHGLVGGKAEPYSRYALLFRKLFLTTSV